MISFQDWVAKHRPGMATHLPKVSFDSWLQGRQGGVPEQGVVPGEKRVEKESDLWCPDGYVVQGDSYVPVCKDHK
jgi:hypothetical protein